VIFVGHDRAQIAGALTALEANGFPATWCATAEDALSELGVAGVVVVDAEQSAAFAGLATDPTVELVLSGSSSKAEEAQQTSDVDFLANIEDPEVVVMRVRHALRHRDINVELDALRSDSVDSGGFGAIIGSCPAMLALFDLIARASSTSASVLITGESGTGKELVAAELHKRGRRADKPFIAVNCSAMPENLLESELFGHVKGAFTDAIQSRQGLFVKASGGTIFLDEIGDMPVGLQAKLLRVLQERMVRPVGSDTELAVDVRVIAATNVALEAAVAQRTFREDLYYRLNVVHISVPPLRERLRDILPLARHFTRVYATSFERHISGMSTAVADRLLSYDWPGNVRELENCLESAVTLARSEEIDLDDLPARIRDHRRPKAVIERSETETPVTLEELERSHIVNVLTQLGGNKKAAAKVLGIDRKTLYRKLEGYGLMDPSLEPSLEIA
jgi:two-component system response regulator HydG